MGLQSLPARSPFIMPLYALHRPFGTAIPPLLILPRQQSLRASHFDVEHPMDVMDVPILDKERNPSENVGTGLSRAAALAVTAAVVGGRVRSETILRVPR